jgi:uncharacterized protein
MMSKILLTVIFAGVSAQLIKLLIYLYENKKLSWRSLIITGGMPSTHAALVISLTAIIYLVEGISSVFVVSLVLALVVLRDSFGVRRSVGNEGRAIEKLLKKHKIKSKFKYTIGHTPLQVLIGSLLGFIVSLLVYYL